MDIFIKDIFSMIFDQLNFMSQTNLRQVSTHFIINYPITNLYDEIPNMYKLTD